MLESKAQVCFLPYWLPVGGSFNYYLRRRGGKKVGWKENSVEVFASMTYLQTLSDLALGTQETSTLIHAFLPQKHWQQLRRGRKVAAGPGT